MKIQTTFIQSLKKEILKSRYQAARLANQELLKLYFLIGKMLDEKVKSENWGAGVLKNISEQLQQELPGLRGFSASSMKRMRRFHNEWNSKIQIGSSLMTQFEMENFSLENFLSISFTHHHVMLNGTNSLSERIFYINKTAESFWSVQTLKHHLKNKLYEQEGTLPNNFEKALPTPANQKAIQIFKDEYLLDFINIEDPDEEPDERVLEHNIVSNIKKFMMSLGSDFSFMGNQYRLIVAENEFFIDLLFFNRTLQCLVAFELKRGKFKPEYMGKMNFYLSALDDLIKKPHENPSIGIILCKEKENKIVEYSFRDVNKPMGVATYKTTQVLPNEYKNALPDPDTLKQFLE